MYTAPQPTSRDSAARPPDRRRGAAGDHHSASLTPPRVSCPAAVPRATVAAAPARPGAAPAPRRAATRATASAGGTRRARHRAASGTAAASVTHGSLVGETGEWDRSTVSPQPLADDLRSADDRDLPSRNDMMGAALSNVVGGPVGRRAPDRPLVLTPLRVMFMIALVFLAMGWSTKSPCLQTVGSGPPDRRVATWGQPARLLRAVLLRHRAALRCRVVEPGQSFRTNPAGSNSTARASPARSSTAVPPCATWSIRC